MAGSPRENPRSIPLETFWASWKQHQLTYSRRIAQRLRVTSLQHQLGRPQIILSDSISELPAERVGRVR